MASEIERYGPASRPEMRELVRPMRRAPCSRVHENDGEAAATTIVNGQQSRRAAHASRRHVADQGGCRSRITR